MNNIILYLLIASFVFGSSKGHECGKPQVLAPLSIGSEFSFRGQWPWYASLFNRRRNDSFFCGSSIISQKHLLSAAHCFHPKDHSRLNPSNVFALLGRYDFDDESETGWIKSNITEIIIHPGWIPTTNNMTYDSDLAIAVLENKITFNHLIQPICLPDVQHEDFFTQSHNLRGFVVGYGYTEDLSVSKKPKHIEIPIARSDVCLYTDHGLVRIGSLRMFCAGERGKLPCRGDSGGGFYTNLNGKWSILGIVSTAADFQCVKNQFVLFTKVTEFVDWIKNAIKPTITRNKDHCLLPTSQGTCNERLRRFYYDKNYGICTMFAYSGCDGNENNFETLEECEELCDDAVEACDMAPLAGSCDQNITKWFFDSYTNQCHDFEYTGCYGNKNNFDDRSSCEQSCHHRVEASTTIIPVQTIGSNDTDICNQPSEDSGDCDEWVVSYSYSPQRGSCHAYYYGGCGGNENRFDSLDECENRCENRQLECTKYKQQCGSLRCPNGILKSYRAQTGCTECSCVGASSSTITSIQPTHQQEGPTVLEEVTDDEEFHISASLGGFATLRCFATGSPSPSIIWKRGGIQLKTDQGRYILSSIGDLQIVQLHRTDAGTYVCSAFNGIGNAVEREINLTVNEPVEGPAYIVGEQNSTLIAVIGQPATLRCAAGGYPKPFATWWRGNIILPYRAETHVITRDNSLTLSKVGLPDLGPYVCQAYNSVGKPVSITVTLKTRDLEPTSDEGIHVPADCTDNKNFANCQLIVKGNYCNAKYYGRFCCRSCTLAGLLNHNTSIQI